MRHEVAFIEDEGVMVGRQHVILGPQHAIAGVQVRRRIPDRGTWPREGMAAKRAEVAQRREKEGEEADFFLPHGDLPVRRRRASMRTWSNRKKRNADDRGELKWDAG